VIRIEQNYKLISEKSLVSLAVSRYDADTVGFVHLADPVLSRSEPNRIICWVVIEKASKPFFAPVVVGPRLRPLCKVRFLDRRACLGG
jgi:hypothetical protein